MEEEGKEKKRKRKRGETEDRQSKKMALGFYISFYDYGVWQMFHACEN